MRGISMDKLYPDVEDQTAVAKLILTYKEEMERLTSKYEIEQKSRNGAFSSGRESLLFYQQSYEQRYFPDIPLNQETCR